MTDGGGAGPASPASAPGTERIAEREPCDHCGAFALHWVKCKLICRNCRQINKSCADL